MQRTHLATEIVIILYLTSQSFIDNMISKLK